MKLKYLYCLIVFLFAFTSCSDKAEEPDLSPKRTVLVYVVGSNLTGNINENIRDMISVATPENLNGGHLVVFFSTSKDKAELYEIKTDENGVVGKSMIAEYEGKSAIAVETMNEIVDKVVSMYPSDGYGMIFSSHGTAWLPTNYSTMLRSFGEESGKNMEIYELKEALSGFHFDFLLFDVCSFGAIECMYELKDRADYIVSSPSEILRAGFPYAKILPCLFTTEADLQGVVAGFKEYYVPSSYGNVSVVKTEALDELATIVKEIMAAVGEEDLLSLPLSDIQYLSYLPYAPTKLYDLSAYIREIATVDQYARFTACLDKIVVNKYSSDVVVCQNGYEKIPIEEYSGLTIYPLQSSLTQLNAWYNNNLLWSKYIYQ
ncbi:hypothetical protein M2459_000574 [Parabacteroides sp. PF5-5]|uniref:clostripain-related cysteine peptidase n=1 Tax=unclassified Parabacteroides TaxID=2649774 RepID=UPI0024756164|nr:MULTISPECIES: clostripain-related cysteine peptidase [unclassified Parabacteroides]MDH6303493.1 hypothetical protein [Parabacteroides sp. PH5-39]MDH6314815.1 hypothetical protein [Parabacteroides sp. PF5-13]MDH6318152.1 hypothetical protein [Parabacteroides sp. PH5-13]MDH6321916.1 hypothetical protein [Parabacteroides sp. PH5-8]MDH6326040.1 hypothetical protein [Parabacteroides sp. PH5-41]